MKYFYEVPVEEITPEIWLNSFKLLNLRAQPYITNLDLILKPSCNVNSATEQFSKLFSNKKLQEIMRASLNPLIEKYELDETLPIAYTCRLDSFSKTLINGYEGKSLEEWTLF